jgi:large subunit ribosomal protein L24
MKASKMRNKQIYRATYRTRSNQLGSALSKDLQKKYGKRSIRVVEGDTVKVVRGEYKDVDGKIAKVSTATSSIAIEGIKKEKSHGDKFDVLIHASNVVVTGLNTDDSWRIAKLEGKQPKTIPKTEKTKEVKSEKPVGIESKEIKEDKLKKISKAETKKETDE